MEVAVKSGAAEVEAAPGKAEVRPSQKPTGRVRLLAESEVCSAGGVVSLASLTPGEVVEVYRPDGTFGQSSWMAVEDEVWRVSVRRKHNKNTRDVVCSPGTPWPCQQGLVLASWLKRGDQILPPPDDFLAFSYDAGLPDERILWCLGYFCGDGKTQEKEGAPWKSFVRLSGKQLKYKKRFRECGFELSEPRTLAGEAVVWAGSYFLSPLDLREDGVRMGRAFVRGYLDACGDPDPEGKPSPYQSVQVGTDRVEWVRKTFPCVGCFLTAELGFSPPEGREEVRFSLSPRISWETGWRVQDVVGPLRRGTLVELSSGCVLPWGLVLGE